MNIKRLELTRIRAFGQAEFDFTPGMNLIVGVNGVGKTTVLDSVRICLSRILPKITASRSKPDSFETEDIRGNLSSLTAKLTFEVGKQGFQYIRHQPRVEIVLPTRKTIAPQTRELLDQRLKGPGKLRKRIRQLEETADAPDLDTFIPDLNELQTAIRSSQVHPIGIYFSTRRSLVSDATSSAGKIASEESVAFAEALSSRELRLAELAHWMHAQAVQARDYLPAERHLAALRRAAKVFLPDCKNLRAETSPKPRLLVDKGRITLDVRQLSDGERGLLALVLDIARRLSQANPGLSDPVKQGKAVVLIDELDLHLHPKWQRTIVERLTTTFHHCQFIATTHSPQVVAAVEPEQVFLLTDMGVLRPDRTLGMDSNWILRHLMEADDRPLRAAGAIKSIEKLIDGRNFKKARTAIATAKKEGWDLPEWSVLEARMARMELLEK
ncbi:MAG: AAA family ATPase [Acidobacteriota bacterium]